MRPPLRPFLRFCSFPLLVTSLSVSKSREIKKLSSLFFYLLLAVLIAATVVCITALALLIVVGDFACWCLRPLLQGLGALSQAQVAVLPHQLAWARCGQAVPASAASLQVPRRYSHLLLCSCLAGAALLLLLLLPCSEHRWPSSHPGLAAGLPHLLCTLLPCKQD